MNRFKTEEEFIKDFGKNWRDDIQFGWYDRMDPLFGQETDKTHGNRTTEKDAVSNINVSNDMLTDVPLKSKTELKLLNRIDEIEKSLKELIDKSKENSYSEDIQNIKSLILTLMTRKEGFSAIADTKRATDIDIRNLKKSIDTLQKSIDSKESKPTDNSNSNNFNILI